MPAWYQRNNIQTSKKDIVIMLYMSNDIIMIANELCDYQNQTVINVLVTDNVVSEKAITTVFSFRNHASFHRHIDENILENSLFVN